MFEKYYQFIIHFLLRRIPDPPVRTGGWLWDTGSQPKGDSDSLIPDKSENEKELWEKPAKSYRLITSPWYNARIFDYWDACFESVFISFKPYYSAEPLGLDTDRFYLWNIPHTVSTWMLRYCDAVPRREILKRYGFANYAEFNNRMLNFKQDDDKIDAVLNDLIVPDTWGFSVQHIEKILSTLYNCGFSKITLGDEFADDFRNMELNDPNIRNFPVIAKNIFRNIFPADRSWLLTNPYDSYETFICGKKDLVEQIVNEDQLEGFYANDDTRFWWSKPESDPVEYKKQEGSL